MGAMLAMHSLTEHYHLLICLVHVLMSQQFFARFIAVLRGKVYVLDQDWWGREDSLLALRVRNRPALQAVEVGSVIVTDHFSISFSKNVCGLVSSQALIRLKPLLGLLGPLCDQLSTLHAAWARISPLHLNVLVLLQKFEEYL